MKFSIITICLLLMFAGASIAVGQDNPYFNGNGINMNRAEPGRTMMFDFSKLVKEPERESEPLFKFPKISLPKWPAPNWSWSGILPAMPLTTDSPLTGSKPTTSGLELPKWNMFSGRNADQPSLLQKMNDRNKEFWGKTRQNFSDWTADQENMPSPSRFDTWDRITRGFQSSSEAPQPPAQPPLRAARQKKGEKTIRY